MVQSPSIPKTYLSDFGALEKGLADREPKWLRQLRQAAFSRFTEMGFPTARRGNEEWKYTDVAPIARTPFQNSFGARPGKVQVADLRRLAPWDEAWPRLVFVDGRYVSDLSTESAGANGVLVMNMAEALLNHADVVQEHLAQHVTVEDGAFSALNTAFLRDGAFVHVPDGVSVPSPVHIVFVTTAKATPAVSHPRTLVVVGRHSKLTLIQSCVGPSRGGYLSNAVTELALGDGAEVEHFGVLMESPEAFHVGTTQVHQSQDSAFSSTSFARGAAVARNNIHALLDGPGLTCSLNGLYMTWGTQHMDNFINVDHAKPQGTSRMYYKGILDGRSKAIFGGTVLVRKDAQKTDSQQKDKNLILSDEAEVDSKPALYIYADDVKCGHGATAGHMDEDALFYMTSRGLDQLTARRMLVHAFAGEIVDTVRIKPLRSYLDRAFVRAMPGLGLGESS